MKTQKLIVKTNTENKDMSCFMSLKAIRQLVDLLKDDPENTIIALNSDGEVYQTLIPYDLNGNDNA